MAKSRKRSDSGSRTGEPPARQAPDNANRDRIAARAYELYLARGGGHGSDWEDWLAAEREFASAGQAGRPEE